MKQMVKVFGEEGSRVVNLLMKEPWQDWVHWLAEYMTKKLAGMISQAEALKEELHSDKDRLIQEIEDFGAKWGAELRKTGPFWVGDFNASATTLLNHS
ncbi:hypothetical protein JCM3774_000013 [Rhodotorula dairenensis]